MRGSQLAALLVVAGKFSKVVIKVLGKLLGMLKGGGATKLALGGTTFGAYSILIDWRFALCLMVLIGIHESGHVWAMKRMGMATRGFYFIPFVGGMAVVEHAFPSAFVEGYVALMGPLWGLFVTLATLGIFFLTHDQVFEIATCWMAFVNLLNLIPIYPLDGGRVIKSASQSFKGFRILIPLALGTAGLIACATQKYWLFFGFGLLGLIDLLWVEIQQGKSKELNYIEKKTKPYAEAFMEKIARLLGLKEGARLDAIEEAIWKFSNRHDEFKRLRKLRQQYQEWRTKWLKFCKRWERLFDIHLNDEILFLSDSDPIAKMKTVFEEWAKTEEKKFMTGNESIYTFVTRAMGQEKGSFLLPDAEYEKLRVLLAEYRELIDQTNETASRLSETVTALCEKTDIKTPPLHMKSPPYREHRDKKAMRALTFLAANTLEGEICVRKESRAWICFEKCKHEAEDKQFWYPKMIWLSAIVETFIIIAADAKARAQFFKKISKYVTEQGMAMPLGKTLVIAASYIALIVVLFLLMEFTGGHEAAKGAVNFFKRF